ncbi:hypothetical protein CT0861_04054 [Colletotrichum tofieldiae]|uniref:Uncharacterized protein n=1 Tax=Colletotrichum tofieldiae TaxID=708197 RepID=A0A166PRV9_9PEZI|nr:hypothetical protein CT0861_04054 [Colletotrichum tofieldiae]
MADGVDLGIDQIPDLDIATPTRSENSTSGSQLALSVQFNPRPRKQRAMERHSVKHYRSRAQHRGDDQHGQRQGLPEGVETTGSHNFFNPRRGDRDPEVALASDTGNSAGLVENWLSNVSRRGIVPPEPLGLNRQGQGHLKGLTWRPHGLPLQDAPRRSHKRTRSQDSSIITSPAKAAALLKATGRYQPMDPTESNDTFVLTDTSSPRFEKRPRHKTRENRYDPRERVRQTRRNCREERPAPSKNLPRKMNSSSREVMDNFRSEVILNDRLTLQPCTTPGLFRNGRVSPPKPVEELAYNSMTSLEHPPSRQSSWQQQKRSQAKQSQRREKELEEMTTFFGRKETSAEHHADYGQGWHRNNHKYRRTGEQILDEYNRPTEPHAWSTRIMLNEAGPGRNETRQPSQSKVDIRSTDRFRSSSRAASYVTWSTSNNRQTTIPNHTSGRSPSSTPDPVREALWETGVFDGTGLWRRDRSSKASFHQATDLRTRNRDLQQMQEHDTLPGISAERPKIVRYTDKGVMTNNIHLLPPGGPEASETLGHKPGATTTENSRLLEAAARANLPHQPAVNETGLVNVHADCSAEISNKTDTPPTRADAATQARLGSQPRENIPIQALPKVFQRTLVGTTTIDEPPPPRFNKIEMRPADAASQHVNATSTSKVAKHTAAESQNKELRKRESAVFGVSGASPLANEKRHIEHPLARDSVCYYQPNLPENRPLTSSSSSQLRNEIDREERAIPKPYIYPRTTSRGSQPKDLHRALITQGYRPASRFNPSHFQHSESMADFIVRIEQDVLRSQNREPARGPIHDHIAYQQRADNSSTPVDQFVRKGAPMIGTACFDQLPRESDWYYLRDAASASGPKAEPFLETEINAQPQNYQYSGRQKSIDQTEEYEREEMNAFWRPNYFYY